MRARVGLDCRGLRSHNRLRGIGSYTRNLVEALMRAGEDLEWVLFGCDGDEITSLVRGHPGAAAVLVPAPAADPVRQLVSEWGFSRRLRAEQLDLVHSLDQNATPFGTVPSIVTVHDLIPQVMGGTYWGPKARLRMLFQRAAARRASRVITTSSYTAGDVERLWKIDGARIRAVPAGVARDFGGGAEALDDDGVLLRYGIEPPYLLYVGGYDPRKNIGNMLLGFRQAAQRGLSLVLAGSADAYEEDTQSRRRELGLETSVKLTGFVPVEDLAPLYRAAEGFIFLSLYEGFGLPLLEAMACGTPVIAARASSLPEVAGDAALLVDPLDVAAIAAAIERLHSDEALRQELAARGAKRAAALSWDETAARTLEVYRELLG